MIEEFSRTGLLIGEDSLEKLKGKRVAVFGIGGVGGYVCEALIRSGVGKFDLFDKDTVSVSNLNRQIIALKSTVGKLKVDVMKERMLDINSDALVSVHPVFFLPENADEYDFSRYDYVVDAVDTVTAKLEIIVRAKKAGVPVISAMGAGNKLHPEMFKVADIYDTKVCPLAKVMRKELKAREIKSLKVVYSEEEPVKNSAVSEDPGRRSTPGSIAFVPSVSGLIIAGEVIKDLAGIK
ncbi:MAG: tRNA threonylcarbamoyladenosine dehydratase [Lachnospiraceae bacterium]|nr:tRNA threonylcarbamoyladenosine dehydratase [Lachnospiraceae bacterium]